MKKHLTVVGAGLFGCTIARLAAEELNYKVTIIEKRNHLGGNCFDYLDDGIYVHKFGSHIFHTNNEVIWNFLNRFSKFTTYKHKVLAVTKSGIFNFPLNYNTFIKFYPEISNPKELSELIDSFKEFKKPKNFREAAINSVGENIYKEFYEGYTRKQWGINPELLPASLFRRIPVHLNDNVSYFNDRFQGLPVHGYTNQMYSLLNHKNIDIQLGVDFQSYKFEYLGKTKTVYSGCLDELFEFEFGHLPWRTLNLQIEKLSKSNFQSAPVINYCDFDIPYTRVHEFKHFPNSSDKSPNTIILTEFPKAFEAGDIPMYPIENESSRAIYKKYKIKASKLKGFHFGGRLGSYKYFDMDMTIANAFKLINDISK